MRHANRVVIVTAVLATLTSCGGEAADTDDGLSPGAASPSGGAETRATPSTETPVAEEAEAEETEVLEAYAAAKEALRVASDPPDPQHPDLLAHWDGEALSRAQDLLSQFRSGGRSLVGSLELDPTVVSLVGPTAVVQDCVRDRAQVVDTASGTAAGPETTTVVHLESQLERRDGRWRIVLEEELSEPCTPR